MKDDNARAYLLVKPHCHDGEDEGGVYEVREGDGKDERSGCLGEIEDVVNSHQSEGYASWRGGMISEEIYISHMLSCHWVVEHCHEYQHVKDDA